MKRNTTVLFLTSLIVYLFIACTPQREESDKTDMRTYADYIDSGKIFAAQIGDVYGAVANDLFHAAEVQEFTFVPDMFEAVRMGKIDAAILDDAYVKQIQDSGQYPDLDYLYVPKEFFVNQASHVFHTEELRNQFNEWFKTIESNGIFDEIYRRWIGVSLPDEKDIPRFNLTGENGTLRVCNTGSFPPFSYADSNNQPVGFDEEIISRFAAHLGMDIEYNMMAYDAIIPFILSGKADMSGCSFTVTDDRSDNVIFGAPYTKAYAVLVVPKNSASRSALSARSGDYRDFIGKSIGNQTGSVWEVVIEDGLKGTPAFYTELASSVEDIRNGRIDGFIIDLTVARIFAETEISGAFTCVDVPAEVFSAPMGAISMDNNIIGRFNAFLAKLDAEGTLSEMQSRWLHAVPDLDAPMPEIPLIPTNGTLRIAATAGALPFSYMGANSELKGYSIELVHRFAAHEDMDIAFTDMEFGALIPYVVSGKADLAIANISITEERKKSVLFTDSIYDERGGIITLKQNASAAPEGSPDITDSFGKTIGIPTGYVFDTMIENDFSGTVAYYSETSAGIEDVRQNRITGFMTDLSIARVIANQPGNSDLMVVPVPETYFSGPLGAISANADMINRFNSFIAELDSDGTLAKMQQFWLEDNPGSDPPMPDISASGSGTKEILKVAIGSGSIPFCYIGADGEIKGLCAELIRRFAARENMEAAFTAMEFSALIPYIASGKADIGIDAITITEERKKSVLFSEPFYYDHAGIIIVKPTVTEASNEIPITDQKGFIKWLQTGIERNLLIDNRWKMIVDGLRVTMTIAVFAQLLGTAFGCFVCWLLTRKNRFTQLIGNAYCGLIHGTPIVVLLMITYYIIFGDTNISNVLIAIAAFTMITGAEVAGNLKGSIDTIDPVEIEAARSIGFSAFKAFMTVTLPQAIRRSLPGYTKGFVELVKATAIVGYIAIQDLTRAGDIIRSRTYDAYFPLLFVAVIYLLVTTICVQLFKLIIRKINGGYMQ